MTDKKPALITVPDLKHYFFQNLSELNVKSLCPVPQEAIFYSSEVLGKYALSESFFETTEEGRTRHKILGTKLLEAMMLEREERRRVYQEVGDTALVLCGYFAESVNRKILDTNYYRQLGVSAYQNLNGVSPRHMNVTSFYGVLASCFPLLTTMIGILASRDRFGTDSHLLLKQEHTTNQEWMAAGITPADKKVS
jgi:hypothetical protein